MNEETYYFLTDSQESKVIRMYADLEPYRIFESETADLSDPLDDIPHQMVTSEEGVARDEGVAEQIVNILSSKMSSEDDGERRFQSATSQRKPPTSPTNVHIFATK